MNNQRRKKIREINSTLTELMNRLEEIKSEEEETLDNMPENLQCSERAMASEEAIAILEGALDNFTEANERLEELL